MSNQFRRTALVTVALAMIFSGVGCAQYQAPASNGGAGSGAYDQPDQRKKTLDY
jgi:hypothetical protein